MAKNVGQWQSSKKNTYEHEPIFYQSVVLFEMYSFIFLYFVKVFAHYCAENVLTMCYMYSLDLKIRKGTSSSFSA